ncbi:fimbrial protein [Pseudenterobacter timonensis]|uniref:Fimbrial protein n=1 Tax=Pseudenterobacter timonensis TaxID=1755099 RepID=A0AAE4DKP8_9ENTR|nr:fimbrial protein [Pseudenterobacter timonensis]MDR9889174.1 fimbrial protein [Pseudenterobacter timonensis]
MLLNAVLLLSRSSMKMLLPILLFITVNFPLAALAVPVCDNTNVGHREIILPGLSISPGVDSSPSVTLYPDGFNSNDLLGTNELNENHFNCYSTNKEEDKYKLYVFMEPLTSYGRSFVYSYPPIYSVVATNVPALGVGFNSNTPMPGMAVATLMETEWSYHATGLILPYTRASYNYLHISLADASLLVPGVVAGSDLPTFGIYGMIYNENGTPYDGKKIFMGTVSFSGSLNIIPFTCQTPDVVVPMGKYKTTDFNGVGSTSQWVDFNIELNDCPGNYPGYNNGRYKNNISVLINPVYGNPTPDSFSLKSGTGSATGIDMQIRKQNDTSMIKMGTGFDPLGPVTGNTNIKQFRIPLQARYIQSGGQVTPGLAESALTFTINYY